MDVRMHVPRARAAFLLALAAAPTLAAATPAKAEDAVTLRWSSAAGERFRQRQTLRQVQAPDAPAGQAPDPRLCVTLEMDVATRGTLEPAAEPAASLGRLVYERIRFRIESAGKTFDYDSAGAANAPPAEQKARQDLDKIIGKTMEVALDAQGRVLSLKSPEGLPQDTGSGNLLNNPLGGFAGLLPDRPVRVGDRWNASIPSEISFRQRGKCPVTYVVENTLKGLEGEGDARVAVIESKVVIAQRAAAPGAAVDLPFAVDGDGAVTSRVLVAGGKVARTAGRTEIRLRPKPGVKSLSFRIQQQIDIRLDMETVGGGNPKTQEPNSK